MTISSKSAEVKPELGRKFTRLALRGITIAMFFLFGLGLLYTVQRFSPGIQERFLPLLLTLVSIEAVLTYLRTRTLEGRDRTLFRVSELVTLAVLLKGFLLFQDKGTVLTVELAAWQDDFLASFFNGSYILHIIAILFTWGATTHLLDLFDQLHDRELDATWEDIGKLSNSLKQIRNQMIAVPVVMLIFLILCTALARASIQIPGLISLETSATYPAWVVMVFTVLLLTQFSLTQFILLRSRWELDRAVMTKAVSRQWLLYGLIFLAIVGILAVLLPTSYSVPFFELLAGLFSFLGQLAGLLFYLLTLPFILLMRLFSGEDNTTQQPPALSLPPLTTGPNSPAHLPPFLEIIRVVIFWAAFIAIIGFAFYQIISANKGVWKTIASWSMVRWVANLLKNLLEIVVQAGGSIKNQLGKIQIAGLGKPNGLLPTLRQPSLPKDPRTRIIVLYKTLVEYAGGQGIKRQDHQTPYQYKEQLENNLPDVTGEVSDVTEGFVEARYSAHPLNDVTADRLADEYSRIKRSVDEHTIK